MYNNEYIFYGYFTKHSEDDFEVSFYDFDNIITCGKTSEESFNMAEDALKLELSYLSSVILTINLITSNCNTALTTISTSKQRQIIFAICHLLDSSR